MAKDYKGKLSGAQIDNLPNDIKKVSDSVAEQAKQVKKATEDVAALDRKYTNLEQKVDLNTTRSNNNKNAIGDLTKLSTTEKGSLVSALNELSEKSQIPFATTPDIQSLFAPSITIDQSQCHFTSYGPSYIDTDFSLDGAEPQPFHEGDYIKIRYDGNKELTYTYVGDPDAYYKFVGPNGAEKEHLVTSDDYCVDNFRFYVSLEGKNNQDLFEVVEMRILGKQYAVSGQAGTDANPKVVTTANLAEFKQQLEAKMEDFTQDSSDENFILGNKVFVGGILEGDSLRLIGEPYSIAGDKVVING